MKTAISVPDDVFEDVSKYSKLLNISRSKLFTKAAKKYISKIKKKYMLKALNEVYDEDDEDDKKFLENYNKYIAEKIIKGEEYW